MCPRPQEFEQILFNFVFRLINTVRMFSSLALQINSYPVCCPPGLKLSKIIFNRLSNAWFPVVFILMLSISLPSLHAQVSGTVTFSPSRKADVQLINLRWSVTDEDAWKQAAEDRLDVMAVQVGITSETLSSLLPTPAYYQLDLGRNALIELLISFDDMADGEAIYLVETNQPHKVIYRIDGHRAERLLTPVFNPDEVMLMWRPSDDGHFRSTFQIEAVYYHISYTREGRDIGFGAAMTCHPNAACKEDSLSRLMAKSDVRVRLVFAEGAGWCSGSFVNNTRQDKTPYLLTAFHCQHGFTPHFDLWRFDLYYASPTCENPPAEPVPTSLTGCTLRAKGQGSDFILVELKAPVPPTYDIAFAGWERDDVEIPDTIFLLHHPRADIRKFSTCTGSIVIHPNQIGWSGGYSTPPNSHFRFKFTEGGHEAGSSGGPAFNAAGRLIGQLHGGTVGCELVNNTYIGRFSTSWDLGETASERLKEWLDPDNTGITTIPALENYQPGSLIDLSGIVKDPTGRPVKGVRIQTGGDTTVILETGADGKFTLQNVKSDGTYTFLPMKNSAPKNGVNVVDLSNIQRHLLGIQSFQHPWQEIAADANRSGAISATDVVEIQRLILGVTQVFSSSPSWRFLPETLQLQPGLPVSLEFTAIKIGDVNGTADPQK